MCVWLYFFGGVDVRDQILRDIRGGYWIPVTQKNEGGGAQNNNVLLPNSDICITSAPMALKRVLISLS